MSGTAALPSASGTASAPAAATPTIAAKAFTGAQLQAALLPAADLGAGFTFQPGFPNSTDKKKLDPLAIKSASCDVVVDGSALIGSESSAIGRMDGAGQKGFAEEILGRYDPGMAGIAVQNIEQQAGAKCATYDSTVSGMVFHHTVSLTNPKLGSEAVLLDDAATTDQGTLAARTLVVRFGDVLVSVGYVGDGQTIKSYDIQGAVRKIAANLGLG